MKYKTFSIRILEKIAKALEAEASQDHRTRNQQIQKILSDHYEEKSELASVANQSSGVQNSPRNGRTNHTN